MENCCECGVTIFKDKGNEERGWGHCDNCDRNYCFDCMEEALKCWGCENITFCNRCDPYSKREPTDEELLTFLLSHCEIDKKEAIKMWQKDQDIIPVTCAVCNNCDETECDNLREQYIPLSPSQHQNTYKLSTNSFDNLSNGEKEKEIELEGAKYYPHRRPLGCCCQCYFPISTNSIGYNIREEWCTKCIKRSIR